MRDMRSDIDMVTALAPAARTTGTTTGAVVDLQGFNSAMIAYQTGAWTDGTHTPSVQHGDDGTNFAAVDADDLQGAFVAVTGTAGQNAVQRVGYVGNKRYLRVLNVTATATTGAVTSAAVLRGDARVSPLA
jgi:hypothetical protein